MTSSKLSAHASSIASRFLLSLSLALLLLGLAAPATAQVPPVVPGFPNVPQTAGDILSGLNAPGQGRTAIIAYHNGVLYTVPEVPSSQPGADFLVRSWDISNPALPGETADFGVTPMPINAHGYLKNGDFLSVGSNWPPEAPWSFQRDSPGVNLRTENPELLCAGVRGCLFAPFFVSSTFWSYGDVLNEPVRLERDWVEMGSFEHLDQTGVIGHPFLLGDLIIFASDQSRTGVATWDVSDPENPVLLDVLTTGGPGGYWPELWGGDGKLYVVFPYRTGGNGIRVVDATDPTDLQFVADQPLGGDAAMYIQFQDEYAFTGSHKVDMRTFQSVLDLDGANTVRPSDGGTGIDTSQFALPLGNLLSPAASDRTRAWPSGRTRTRPTPVARRWASTFPRPDAPTTRSTSRCRSSSTRPWRRRRSSTAPASSSAPSAAASCRAS